MNDPLRADTLIPPTWKPALAARMASLVTRGGFSGRTAKQPFPKISARWGREAVLSQMQRRRQKSPNPPGSYTDQPMHSRATLAGLRNG
jgi:hypothetical protein